jgi:hypothetical protein
MIVEAYSADDENEPASLFKADIYSVNV